MFAPLGTRREAEGMVTVASPRSSPSSVVCPVCRDGLYAHVLLDLVEDVAHGVSELPQDAADLDLALRARLVE
jgi:hypothetical protein